jgi:hypothetical protein
MTTYTLNLDGDHFTEDEDLDRMIGMGEDSVCGAMEPRTFTVEDDSGQVVAVITNRRITGKFTKQAWGGRKGDEALFIECVEFDATDAVLRMSLEEIQSLEDSSESTDDLGRLHVQWDGPHEVAVVNSILDFFGVEDLHKLTEDALRYVRNRLNPREVVEETIKLTIKVVVRMPKPESEDERQEMLSSFVDNLDYSVLSNSVGVTVKNTEITGSSDTQA